jgi:hypothetical protein
VATNNAIKVVDIAMRIVGRLMLTLVRQDRGNQSAEQAGPRMADQQLETAYTTPTVPSSTRPAWATP